MAVCVTGDNACRVHSKELKEAGYISGDRCCIKTDTFDIAFKPLK